MATFGVLTSSDLGASGQREDVSGQRIREILTTANFELRRYEVLPDEQDLLEQRLRTWADEILPEKYFIRFSATPQEKLIEVVIIMLLGLIIAYMILASQFNSFIDPFIIFLAIPFGLTGSLFALYLGGQTLNIYSIIGVLLTMGIVMKNSILLVEFTNQLRDRGKSTREALTDACSIRLRPILMTNSATLAAAIPPAIGLGPGAEIRIPMALTIIGGVTVAVFFTLFVVPTVYLLVNPRRRHILEDSGTPPMDKAA